MTEILAERERERETRILSMFAGIGGFELGFNFKGFRTIWANEMDKYAVMTFKDNFPHINIRQGDIREIPAQELPEHDLLVGGFPCQPWSTARQGNEKGLLDHRGYLFKEIVRVLEYHKPTYFLLENVKGIVSKKNKEAFNMIISELERLGYKVDYKILNAKHYGLPQNRARVFILGNLRGLSFKWPEPLNTPTKISDILEKEVESKYYISEEAWKGMLNRQWKQSGSNKTTFDFKEKYGNSDNIHFQHKWTQTIASEELNKEGISPAITASTTETPFIYQRRFKEGRITENCPTLHANPGGTGYPLLINRSRVFNTFSENEPHTATIKARYYKDGSEALIYQKSPTLTASQETHPCIFQNRRGTIRTNKENISPTLTGNMGEGGNNQPHIYQNRPRKLTPRECLRLQGFPEWFNIVVSNSQIYKQIGNAVAVPVINAIAKEIYKQWIKNENEK